MKKKVITSPPEIFVDIIGREEALKEIDIIIDQTKKAVIVTGIGGVGKTEICKAYFNEYINKYSYIGWINYVGSIKQSIVNQISSMQSIVKKEDTIDEKYKKIIDFLNNLGDNTLLIIDNLDKASEECLREIRKFRCKILTSSRTEFDGFKSYSLEFLDVDKCKELFYEYYQGKKDDGNLIKVIDLAGRHTLAIELIAKTAEIADISIQILHKKLISNGFNLNDVIKERVSLISLDKTEEELFFNHLLKVFDLYVLDKVEIDALVNLSILPSVEIDISNLKKWLKYDSNKTIISLAKKGVINKKHSKVKMHPLIQEIVNFKFQPNYDLCKELIQSINEELKRHIEINWVAEKDYMVLAQSILNYIDEENMDVIALMGNLASAYSMAGNLQMAIKMQMKAQERLVKIEECKVYEGGYYNNLAQMYQKNGDLDNAIIYLEKSLEFFDKNAENITQPRLTALNNLGSIYKDKGKYGKALIYLSIACDLQEKMCQQCRIELSKDEDTFIYHHRCLINSYMIKSMVLKDKGDCSDALDLQLYALKLLKEIVKEDDLMLAAIYNNLALIYKDNKQITLAKKYINMSIKIRKIKLDENHPHLIGSYNNLGNLFYLDGDFKKALEYQTLVIEKKREIYGENHFKTAISYSSIAAIYIELDLIEDALYYEEKALQIQKGVLDSNHNETSTSYNTLAMIECKRGNFKSAEKYQKLAINIMEHNENLDMCIAYYINLYKIYLEFSKIYEATDALNKALYLAMDVDGYESDCINYIKRKIEDLSKHIVT